MGFIHHVYCKMINNQNSNSPWSVSGLAWKIIMIITDKIILFELWHCTFLSGNYNWVHSGNPWCHHGHHFSGSRHQCPRLHSQSHCGSARYTFPSETFLDWAVLWIYYIHVDVAAMWYTFDTTSTKKHPFFNFFFYNSIISNFDNPYWLVGWVIGIKRHIKYRCICGIPLAIIDQILLTSRSTNGCTY